jgi:hypothetical protein
MAEAPFAFSLIGICNSSNLSTINASIYVNGRRHKRALAGNHDRHNVSKLKILHHHFDSADSFKKAE